MTMLQSVKEMYNCCDIKANSIIRQAVEIDNAEELRTAPTNELNIRRFAEVTTAIKNFSLLEPSLKELEETETSLIDYTKAKMAHQSHKNAQNAEGVINSLKKLTQDIEDTITDIWAMCDCEAEKETIRKSITNITNKIK